MLTFDLSNMRHIKEVCRIGQGAACCRYLIMSDSGWECWKIDKALRQSIDNRVQNMIAKGDNCEGKDKHFLNS